MEKLSLQGYVFSEVRFCIDFLENSKYDTVISNFDNYSKAIEYFLTFDEKGEESFQAEKNGEFVTVYFNSVFKPFKLQMVSDEKLFSSFSICSENLAKYEHRGQYLEHKLFVDYILNYLKENKGSKKILVTYIFCLKTDHDQKFLISFLNAKYSHKKLEDRIRQIYQFTMLGMDINFDLNNYLSLGFIEGFFKQAWYLDKQDSHVYFNKYHMEAVVAELKELSNNKRLNTYSNNFFILNNIIDSFINEDKIEISNLMYKLYQVYLYEMNAALNYKKEINIEDMDIAFFVFLDKYLVNRGLFLYNYNFVNQGTILT